MTSVATDKDVYRQSFERFFGAARTEPQWLQERRTSAFERFVEQGLPGPRDESWRQTPIGPVTRTRWVPAEGSRGEAGAALLGSLPAHVTLVDGHVEGKPSTLAPGDTGVEVYGLADLLAGNPSAVEPHLGRVLSQSVQVFAELNTAFATDGVVIFVPPGTVLETPIHIAHVATGGGTDSVSYARVLVVAGKSAEVRVVETFSGPPDAVYLANAVTEVAAGDNAFVDHYKLQIEGPKGYHVATLSARLGRDARFSNHTFSFGAAISRNDIEVLFEAEGGDCVLNGLFMLDGARLTDTHSRVDHAQPHCSSHELYKGVLDGSSRGVFNGLVQVRPGAQKTNAEQMNRNLLLSPEALVHSVPQLEILADDVKCRHGSTTGQLDPGALFYLRSRGIGETEARSLLTYAFASDLVQDLSVGPLREAILEHLQSHLPGMAFVREATP